MSNSQCFYVTTFLLYIGNYEPRTMCSSQQCWTFSNADVRTWNFTTEKSHFSAVNRTRILLDSFISQMNTGFLISTDICYKLHKTGLFSRLIGPMNQTGYAGGRPSAIDEKIQCCWNAAIRITNWIRLETSVLRKYWQISSHSKRLIICLYLKYSIACITLARR